MTLDNVIRTMEDLKRFDQSRCDIYGEYRVVPRPVHGDKAMPEDYAVVVLDDGTEMYIEVYDTPQAKRDASERNAYHGVRVHIVGTAHRRMPTIAQGPLAPCISNIQLIEKSNE